MIEVKYISRSGSIREKKYKNGRIKVIIYFILSIGSLVLGAWLIWTKTSDKVFIGRDLLFILCLALFIIFLTLFLTTPFYRND